MNALTEMSTVHSEKRPRKSRTKSGCLTCRNRRKKCDEQRPSCGKCTRSNVCCTWPTFQITLSAEEPKGRRKRKSNSRQQDEDATQTWDYESQEPSMPSTALCESISSPMTLAMLHDTHCSTSFPSAIQLLEFFMVEGSKGLSGRAPSDDPFVRLALQLSQSDELVRSGILALSGSRMWTQNSLVSSQEVALHHYNGAMKQLRSAVDRWPPSSGEEMISLLTASILLCHYEAMLGNEQDTLQSHMRACREMVKIAQQHPSNEQYSAVYGVLFEAYAYYSIQLIFRHSASELDIQANMDSLEFYRSLTTYSTFGYLMLGTCELYALVPYVALFGLQMREVKDDHRPQEVETTYRRLESKLLSLQGERLDDCVEASVKVASIYQNSLLIILHASYFFQASEQDILAARLRPIISETMTLFESIKDTNAASPAFWPMVILGSCLSQVEDRERLLTFLDYGGLKTGTQARAYKALQWIWDHPEESTFGPAGLERFSTDNNTGLCIG